ncbi:MAG: hypothetical protein COX65_00085 [Elusimicrobia bacterium CG_4_10_14_0_2_um_filter_56_8]|nr:MAG: hypothetical protein AUJ51_07965 [Elusimicrobia bacterium CG1_02_56_21]PJA18014.1 MAG: hypothetical protein COX65_00085 [Elusimicrobia bacterium CG_4_10_14_0_2_um_filter_56_8]
MKKLLSCAILISLASSAIAQEAPAPKKWKDASELSYVQTSGNSKTSTLAARNLFNYNGEKSALEVAAGGLGTESEKVVTAEQYNASAKVSQKVSDKNYTFEKLGWDKNRFAGILDRYDLAVGLGRNLLDLPNDKLSLEAGGGYIFEDRIGSNNQSFGTYRGYVRYTRTLSPTANAGQNFEYLGNMQDAGGYRITSETSLISNINSHFSLKTSYLWKYANSPAAGFDKTDTITAMSIIVNY